MDDVDGRLSALETVHADGCKPVWLPKLCVGNGHASRLLSAALQLGIYLWLGRP